MLDSFGTVITALGIRAKPYPTQIVSTILWRLNNESTKVRQQAADLTTRLAIVIKQYQWLSKLGLVILEQLGEEYPDMLGSIIATEIEKWASTRIRISSSELDRAVPPPHAVRSNNMLDHHAILDLVPTIATLFFERTTTYISALSKAPSCLTLGCSTKTLPTSRKS
ncbi:hypothetical protein C8F01DRAFT_92073 [Mycena amicta]|nr:hypothetical protein C8F01DRAFT_92073 [Mycena amicta]